MKWKEIGINCGFFLAAAVLGLISFLIQSTITPGTDNGQYFLLTKIIGSKGVTILTLCCLLVSGGILGFLRPRFCWLWGIGTMFIFPVITIIEVSMDMYSHNLFPFELLMYAVLTIPGIAGAYLGSFIRSMVTKAKKNSQLTPNPLPPDRRGAKDRGVRPQTSNISIDN